MNANRFPNKRTMFVKSPVKESTLSSSPSVEDNKRMKMPKSNCSDAESVEESDSSTTVSVRGSTPGRVCRWSKFVRNLYEMAVNPVNARAVGFSSDGLCLEVRDAKMLSAEVLQKYFKHKNVSSFIRQLNNYGFKTVPVVMNSHVTHCFAHDCFQRDRIDLLEGVTRRTASSDAQKIGERISALREKESEFEQHVTQLARMNEELKRQNAELMEENKRLKHNWMAVQDTLKSRMYEQQQVQPIQQPRHSFPPPPPISDSMMQFDSTPHESFMLPTFPALFPEEF